MCWNAEVSLNTYLFSLFGFAVGIANQVMPVPHLLFMLLFSHVQLAEYFLWRNLQDPKLTMIYSIFLFGILLMEPYAAGYTITDTRVRWNFLIAYTLVLLLLGSFYMNLSNPWYVAVAKNGHLQWSWMQKNNLPFILIWSAFLLAPFLLNRNYTFFLFGFLTFLLSFYFFWREDTFGSMWCWIATSFWFVVIYKAIAKTKWCGYRQK